MSNINDPGGSHTLAAVYGGDDGFDSATSDPVYQTVNLALPAGWTVDSGGVAGGRTSGTGFAGTPIVPTSGSYMLWLSTAGTTPTAGYQNDLGDPGTTGTIVRGPVTFLQANTTVSLNWFFTSSDYNPYRDFALGLVSGLQMFTIAQVTGSNYDSGWNSASLTVADAGSYQLVLVVSNVGDGVLDSELYVANVVGFPFEVGATQSDLATSSPAGPSSSSRPLARPAVTGVRTASGPTSGGTLVTLTGNDFTGATAVTFGGVGATSFVVNSRYRITAVAPAHAAGVVDVRVITPRGTSALTPRDRFTYVASLPRPAGMAAEAPSTLDALADAAPPPAATEPAPLDPTLVPAVLPSTVPVFAPPSRSKGDGKDGGSSSRERDAVFIDLANQEQWQPVPDAQLTPFIAGSSKGRKLVLGNDLDFSSPPLTPWTELPL